MVFQNGSIFGLLVWFSPVLVLVLWFPFWVLLVFLSYWLLIPKLYLFQWLKLKLSWGAHGRLLFTEIWMLWLFYLCIRGFQETIPLDQAGIFFWLRHGLLIPISLFMIYRSWKPGSSWITGKIHQAQVYLHQDLLVLLGNYLEHQGGHWVLKYLSWLDRRGWNENPRLFRQISLVFLVLPWSLVVLSQYWAFFMAKDLSWSLLSLPLLLLPRIHSLVLEFLPFFIQASFLGNKLCYEEGQSTLQCFDHTQSSLEESQELFEDYIVFLGEHLHYVSVLRWSLVFLISGFLVQDTSLGQELLGTLGGEGLLGRGINQVHNHIPPHTRGYAIQAYRIPNKNRQILLEGQSQHCYKRGHMIFCEELRIFISPSGKKYLFVQGEATTQHPQAWEFSQNTNIKGTPGKGQSVLGFFAGEVMIALNDLQKIPSNLLQEPRIQKLLQAYFSQKVSLHGNNPGDIISPIPIIVSQDSPGAESSKAPSLSLTSPGSQTPSAIPASTNSIQSPSQALASPSTPSLLPKPGFGSPALVSTKVGSPSTTQALVPSSSLSKTPMENTSTAPRALEAALTTAKIFGQTSRSFSKAPSDDHFSSSG